MRIFPTSSEMARRTKSFEWQHTPLGPISGWPEHLGVAVSMVLDNPFPQVLLCGPELIVCAYNDSYAPLLGRKPEALGCSFLEVWAEARSTIEPTLRQALEGKASRFVDAEFLLLRNGGPETAYFDYSFSPVRDPSGNVFAVVNTAVEKTAEVRLSHEAAERAKAEASLRESEAALRESEARLRIAIKNAAIIPAQMDRDLRYTWIYNPHPDFDADAVIGKRDDELEDSAGARELMALKRRVIESGRGERENIRFDRSDGVRVYDMHVEPLHDARGAIVGLSSSSLDVTERVRAEEALESMNAALMESDRRKDEFLAMAAHELRNPLAPIQSAIDSLRLKGDADTIQQVLPMMQRQSTQLKRLTDDLLDITRITKDKFTLAKESVDLRQVIRDAVEAALAKAQRHIRLDLPERPLRLPGDEVRLRQAIGNVVDNACKYTKENGNIWISADRDGNEAVIRIADDGQGIAPEFLDRIFDRFEQAGSPEGLGLGLTLTRELVEMHGGSIEARSAGIGHGSEFILRLPVSASAAEAVEGQDRHHGRDAARRVLVVDDNLDAACALQLLLKTEGHLVEVAHDGQAALEALEAFEPEVMLLDIGLPGMDGVEVAKLARAKAAAEELIIIAVTGWGRLQDKARTRDAGCDHHLIKPIDVEALRGLLRP